MKCFGLALALILALAGCNSTDGEHAAATDKGEAAAQPSATAAPVEDAATLLGSLSHPRQKGRYAPRDDCAGKPGADEFRRQLATAVVKGDAKGVAALASPDIKLGFGGDDGMARFVESLQDTDGELMAELRQILPMGCGINDDGSLTIPWYFYENMGDIDTYAAMIVTGEDVPLRAKADASSAVKQRLSWDAVELEGGLFPDRQFQKVRTRAGSEGFVATDKLRSLLSTRLLASQDKGHWKIAAIVSGD